jgi:hypothetical protein
MNNIERQLQLCLNKIEKWAMENGFKFSNSKTFKILARLFILILNNVTEKMLPWGTPISCS